MANSEKVIDLREAAREFFGCAEDEIQIVHTYRCASERSGGCEALTALLERVARERDAVWCAAIIPEGAPLIQRVTERVNDPRFVAEVARIRAAAREE